MYVLKFAKSKKMLGVDKILRKQTLFYVDK